ncbi:MAG: hypothetical protein JWO19_353 [Bryobacterales bacterium]|nr:hypothetical protein [Bryobacterales bacterium]
MKLLWRFVLASVPLVAQISPTINDLPSREFGQLRLTTPPTSSAANLVEGRELNSPLAVAFSPSGGAMYVADANNNRVLAWLNTAGLTKGNQADKVIGQRDFFSTTSQGPGRDLSSGLTAPTGVAVDGNGNLYVVDSGNSRVVRYPNPFNQSSDPLQIDLVIGQKTQSSGNSPNEGNAKPTNKTLALVLFGAALRSSIAIDAQGNLWVADAANNRVLRFPASQLAAGTIEPAADLVLGQPDFISNTTPTCSSANCQIVTSVMLQPQSLAFDASGALYVADGYARVLYYPTPNSGVSASKVLGVVPAGPAKPVTNEYGLANGNVNGPLGVFTNGNAVFVADTVANRVVRYNSVGQYTPTDTAPSPKIDGVIGQPDLLSGKINRGLTEPDATSLAAPSGGTFDNAGNLWLADTGNNRLLSYPASGSFSYTSANVVVGQTDFPFNAPNLIEGKEVWIFNNGSPGGGIVVDKSSNPPHLYIADTFNNRVLGFRDARAVGTDARSILTQKADLVIGQSANDLFRSIVNYPSGDRDLPTRTGLYRPVGVAVDDSGNLWVADSGNGRVLRFPAPFNVSVGTNQSADLVLGQRDFTQKDQSATQQTMRTPFGVAFFPDGQLAVSDADLNRVLVFRKPFSNGENAFTIVGQQNFAASGSSTSLAGLNSPRHVATDSSGRLYVCDSSNSRVVVYRDTSVIAQTGPAAAFNFPNFSSPQGIAVSPISGEMWVAAGNAVFHLPEVTTYQNSSTILQTIGSYAPMAVALDSFDNPIVAEAINRITFYFAKLAVRNAFTFTSLRPLTPGMWVQAAPIGKLLNVNDEVHETPPYPKTVAGLQMLVNGVQSGIYAVVQKTYVNFVIPWSAPTTGPAEFVLFNPTTSEIVAAGTLTMAVADPAFKTVNGAGTGQILAANIDDGGLNGPQNPVSLGKTLQLALTGQGLVNNPPADGVAPSGLVRTNPADLHVFLNAKEVPAANILFSGLDPTYPGSWIINLRIPTVAEGGPPPGTNNVPIIVTMRDVASNWGYDPTNSNNDIPLQVSNGRVTTIAVK